MRNSLLIFVFLLAFSITLSACIPPSQGVGLGSSWCQKGQVVNQEVGNTKTTSEIVGFEDYKGKTYCKTIATSTTNNSYGTVTATTEHYFLQDVSESWSITTTVNSATGGEPVVHEIHMVNGEVVT